MTKCDSQGFSLAELTLCLGISSILGLAVLPLLQQSKLALEEALLIEEGLFVSASLQHQLQDDALLLTSPDDISFTRHGDHGFSLRLSPPGGESLLYEFQLEVVLRRSLQSSVKGREWSWPQATLTRFEFSQGQISWEYGSDRCRFPSTVVLSLPPPA